MGKFWLKACAGVVAISLALIAASVVLYVHERQAQPVGAPLLYGGYIVQTKGEQLRTCVGSPDQPSGVLTFVCTDWRDGSAPPVSRSGERSRF